LLNSRKKEKMSLNLHMMIMTLDGMMHLPGILGDIPSTSIPLLKIVWGWTHAIGIMANDAIILWGVYDNTHHFYEELVNDLTAVTHLWTEAEYRLVSISLAKIKIAISLSRPIWAPQQFQRWACGFPYPLQVLPHRHVLTPPVIALVAAAVAVVEEDEVWRDEDEDEDEDEDNEDEDNEKNEWKNVEEENNNEENNNEENNNEENNNEESKKTTNV
jgi:hypothetical protein